MSDTAKEFLLGIISLLICSGCFVVAFNKHVHRAALNIGRRFKKDEHEEILLGFILVIGILVTGINGLVHLIRPIMQWLNVR